MKLVRPSFEVLAIMHNNSALDLIEEAGRTCYKSEDKITGNSSKKFVADLIRRGHHSVLEHSAMTIKFTVDRGVSHELVRHRLCSFSQESTRYCNYKDEVTFIIPSWLNIKEGKPILNDYDYDTCEYLWLTAIDEAELIYQLLIHKHQWSPQQARTVLPNSLKTELVMTTNFREWRHIFSLRCDKASHPQMREIMIPTLDYVKTVVPVVFDDLTFQL